MDHLNYEELELNNQPHKEEISELELSWILLHDYMIGGGE